MKKILVTLFGVLIILISILKNVNQLNHMINKPKVILKLDHKDGQMGSDW